MNGPQQSTRTRPRVVVIGPSAPAVGGMVTVIDQLLSGPLAGDFEFTVHPANSVPTERRSLLRSVWRHLGQIARLARQLHSGGADLLHVHTCSGFTFYRNLVDICVARALGVPVVVHIHGAQFDAFCAGAGPLGRRLIRRGLALADRVVVLSDHWRQILSPYAPTARFVVVPNGVPVGAARPGRADGVAGRPCEFLFLGSLGLRKGIDTLLEAAAELRDRGVAFRLTLAGPLDDEAGGWSLDGDLRKHRLGSCVEWIGPVTGDAKEDLLARCDCLVLPSRAEGLPLVLLEAGARRRAVVAASVGAIPEVINNSRSGLTVPPDDPQRLAEAMTTVAGNPSARQAMADALHERIVERFSLEHQSRLLGAVYRQLSTPPPSAQVGCPCLAGGQSG